MADACFSFTLFTLQEEEEEDEVKPRVKTTSSNQYEHISRRDLFLKSLAIRTKTNSVEETEKEKEVEVPKDNEADILVCEGSSMTTTDDESDSRSSVSRPIPTLHEKIKFRKSLQSAASMVYHGKTGLPLTSSPAPLRRGQDRFDFDSALTDPAHINSATKRSHPLRYFFFTFHLLVYEFICIISVLEITILRIVKVQPINFVRKMIYGRCALKSTVSNIVLMKLLIFIEIMGFTFIFF